MSNKRRPTSELNHDNWNEEEEAEEPGTFKKAAEDVLSRRVVKAARRRLPQSEDGAAKSAFGSFTGFKKTTPATNSASLFSFVRGNSSTSTPATTSSSVGTNKIDWNGSVKVSENGTSASPKVTAASLTPSSPSAPSKPKIITTGKESTSSDKPAEYYAKLKGLNQGVAKWIKTHVDANPVCILTPIFRDYEKYLKEIEQRHGKPTESLKTIESDPKKIELSKPAENSKSGAISEEKKASSFIFGTSSSKPETSIFAKVSDSPKSIFSSTTDAAKSVFSATIKSDNNSPFSIKNTPSSETNIFSSKSSQETKGDEETKKTEEKPTTGLIFPQTTTSSSPGLFSFGQSPSTANTATAGFSFGGGKPFTFGVAEAAKSQDSQDKKDEDNKEDEDEEPPKPDFKPVTEDGSIFEQRCKVYVKKDGSFSDRGVGTLFLKPAPNGKMQLIVRAVNSLGNILLNTLLTDSIPVKKLNKNSIMLVCLPLPTAEPPPVATLLRVKTEEEADALLEVLQKHKK